MTTTLTGAGFVVTRDSATFGDVEVTIDTEPGVRSILVTGAGIAVEQRIVVAHQALAVADRVDRNNFV